MIVKPLDGHGGESVFLASADDRNLNAILEAVTRFESRPIMAQRYLAEIREGDKRLIVLDGEPLGCTLRVPRDDENRGNIHVGGNCVKADITARDREICAMMRPRLKRDGLYFVGTRHHRQLPDRGQRDLAHGNPGDRSARRRQPRSQGNRFRRGADRGAQAVAQGTPRCCLTGLPDALHRTTLKQKAVARDIRDRYELRPPLRHDACHPGGQVAQSVEQKTENLRVECSIHSLPTNQTLDFTSPAAPSAIAECGFFCRSYMLAAVYNRQY